MVALGLVVLAAVLAVGAVLAHVQARFAFVEIALTNGLAPPAAGDADMRVPVQIETRFDPAAVEPLVGPDAVVVFVSATCSTCVRLVDDLSAPSVPDAIDFQLFFEQDPPIVARRGVLHERQRALIEQLAVPALPYAVVMSNGHAAAHGPVPHIGRLDTLMATGGHRHRLPSELASDPVGQP